VPQALLDPLVRQGARVRLDRLVQPDPQDWLVHQEVLEPPAHPDNREDQELPEPQDPAVLQEVLV